MRQVADGERFSDRGNRDERHSEIYIYDDIGPKGGSLICTIQDFHCVDVVMKGKTTELWFEGRFPIAMPSGVVMCAEEGESTDEPE